MREIPEAIVAGKTGTVRVIAFNANDEQQGAYICKDLDLSQKVVPHDFTAGDAEQFITPYQYTKEATLNLVDYPDNTIKVKVGEAVEIKDVAVTMLADGVPVAAPQKVSDFTLASDSANLEVIEGKTIVGKAASNENELTITCKDGATGTATVIVTDADTYPVTLAIDTAEQPATGDTVTVTFSVGGGEEQSAEVTPDDYTFYKGVADTLVTIAAVSWKHEDVVRTATVYDDEVTISAETDNVVNVAEWEAETGTITIVDQSTGVKPQFQSGEMVVIEYQVNWGVVSSIFRKLVPNHSNY